MIRVSGDTWVIREEDEFFINVAPANRILEYVRNNHESTDLK